MLFDDIVGQSHVSTTLKNAIGAGRLSHAYLFGGPRGVGKTTTARILAKAINCLHPKDTNPDNTCDLCREITEGRSVNVFEIDGASNRGVDEIRNLRESVRYAPATGKYKVYIIDEVHMLTKEAFNALLKTLEEPPPYVIFIFATTEIHKVPLTILSRCQRFDFRRIPISEITNRLRFIAKEERISIDEEALFLIAKRGDGSMRDAQSIFDQVVSFTGMTISADDVRSMLNMAGEELFFKATDIIRGHDVRAGLLLINTIITSGIDIREFLNGFTEHLHNLLIARSTGSSDLIESSDEYKKKYIAESASFTEGDLLRLISVATQTEAALRWSQRPAIRLELGFVQMIRLDSSVEITTLLNQIDELSTRSGPGPGYSPDPREMNAMPVPSQRETVVRGSVKATQPTLRADQIVNPPPPVMMKLSSPTPSTPPAGWTETRTDAVASEKPHLPVTEPDITGRWSAFVEEASRQRIAVGTMLGAATPLGIMGNRLQIGCPDDFHLDAFQRNKQFLSETAKKIYGGTIQLEPVVSGKPAASAAIGGHEKGQQGNASSQHPVVQALIREFGAREVE
jgi:DNA polymerase III subunit gamma/tau